MKIDLSVSFITKEQLPGSAVAELTVHGDVREVSVAEKRAVNHPTEGDEHVYRFSRLASASSVKLAISQLLFGLTVVLADHGVLGEDDEVLVDRVFANVVSR